MLIVQVIIYYYNFVIVDIIILSIQFSIFSNNDIILY